MEAGGERVVVYLSVEGFGDGVLRRRIGWVGGWLDIVKVFDLRDGGGVKEFEVEQIRHIAYLARTFSLPMIFTGGVVFVSLAKGNEHIMVSSAIEALYIFDQYK